ncbi:MAG: hypothetical protein HY782_18315 [Chloroflexi bacterium]|nr:hypothetical protein [Chloroflexota bacterium]
MKTRFLALSRLELLIGTAVLVGLYLSSLYSYLLFHSVVELFSVVVACGIFILAWNARRFLDNSYLLFLGISFLFIGGVNVLHTLAYAGMGVFRGETANLPTQLWILQRYLLGFTLLGAPLLLGRKLKAGRVFCGYLIAVTLLLASIFYWRIFPDCYLDGTGLTPFKKTSEVVIALMLLGGLGLLIRERHAFDREVLGLLTASIVTGIISDLVFVTYVSVYDISNLTGHLFELASFYFVYKAIIETGLVKPYDLVFRELKQNEAALRAAKTELENRVAEIHKLNLELERRAVDLETANQELEAFSYSVSHDLRAPLRSIQGFADILLNEYGAQLPSGGQRFLQLVHDNAVDMDALVNGLLTFSRLSRQALQKQTVAMDALVRDAFDSLRNEQDGRKIEMAISDLPNCLGDPLLLKQVWLNLLSNALKFTCRREIARIEIGYCTEDDGPAYFVKDNGVGFNSENADRLFGVFQRYHHAEDYAGTGLGLAIVARIVRRHGGRVWAESEVDHGAAFYFTL